MATGNYWRTLLAAIVSTIIWLSRLLVFEPVIVPAFVHALAIARHDLLTLGTQGWGKLQSIYGYLRLAGVTDTMASAAQGIIAVACATATIIVWRMSLSYE